MSVQMAPSLLPKSAPRASLLCDFALPAVQFLTGPDAADVLRAPIEAAGGDLVSATPRHVQYRPGSDLIVKYAAEVAWPGRSVKRETIMAAAKLEGVHEGAIPVAALVSGRRVEVGVWRWPFDPVLVGLRAAVTPRSAAELCQIDDVSSVSIKVLAFRPTERAVVRVSTPTEVVYLKVVAPSALPGLVLRHRAATAAGVPVPVVRHSSADLGVVAFEELTGPLLKDEIKAGRPGWPHVDEFDRLADQFARIDTDLQVVPSRVADGVLHAAMLRTVANFDGGPLSRLADAFSSFASDVELQTIHGDLHEGQIIVDGARVVGILDLDDLGVGSPLEERANLLGFLRYRAITLPVHRFRITAYADRLRRNGMATYGQQELDIATAAVLVGLATGPFRIQQTGWRNTVSTLIAHAETHLPVQRTHIARNAKCPDHLPTTSPILEES